LHTDFSLPEASTLYVVATPIGNLRDVTLRALDVLRGVDLVAAEDTRHSRRLLDAYGIGTRLVAAHEHNEAAAADMIVDSLRTGRSVALVTDAGTPAVSDPGARIVSRVREAGLRVVPVPGPSAVVAALSASGSAQAGFAFHGFLPTRAQARRSALEGLRDAPVPVVLFEAPHRVRETLAAMREVLGPERRITICRELTKAFEEIHACALADAVAWTDADPHRVRGEFVLVLHAATDIRDATGREGDRVLAILLRELPASQAARLAAEITGARRSDLYDKAVACAATSG
jgi:16S rRNA (cytidine1402-2'-O)-methyltransferase